jgi:Protein of unknown function (DUF4230)
MAMGADQSFESGQPGLPAGSADEPTVRHPVGRVPARREPHPTAELPEVDTGTGWPDEEADERPVHTMTRREPAFDEDDVARPPRRRLGGCLFWLAGFVALIVVVVLGLRLTNLWPSFHNPFGEKKTDRSQPTLLLSIQDLSRFEAASGNFQEVIDVQQDRSFIPDIIFNDRTLFVCVGSVDAYVDFHNVGNGDITDSADHKSVTVRLPGAQLEKPNIDHDKSYVFATQQGLINRIGDMFSNNPNKQQELYQLGEQRIGQAARDSGLVQRAQDNTKGMLIQLLRSLGYTDITVIFASS